MGGAMLSGWIERGADPGDITVIEPHAASAAAARDAHGVRVLETASDLPDESPAVVVFAVKPQTLPDMASDYAPVSARGAVALSIAAGRPIAFFEGVLGADAAVVRSMPNTPAAVGRGITAACANPNVSDIQQALCQRLLTAIGEVVWVEDESLIDAVTAVSGSGPAYVFLLIVAVPYALPLAVWVGVVSQFIPAVGTYLAALAPVLVALTVRPITAVVVVVGLVVYQQIENVFLSPRITARTMSLHPAVAFGSVLVGAALLGVVGVLVALPATAIIQAFVSTYVEQHNVDDEHLGASPEPPTDGPGPPAGDPAAT